MGKTSACYLDFNRVRLPASIQSKTKTKKKGKRRYYQVTLKLN